MTEWFCQFAKFQFSIKFANISEFTVFVPIFELLLTVPRRCFFCGSFILFVSCFGYAFVRVCLLMPCVVVTCWEELTSWLSFVMSNCEVVTFSLVSWVRCGAWLYRFLIFALFLTLTCSTFTCSYYAVQRRLSDCMDEHNSMRLCYNIYSHATEASFLVKKGLRE